MSEPAATAGPSVSPGERNEYREWPRVISEREFDRNLDSPHPSLFLLSRGKIRRVVDRTFINAILIRIRREARKSLSSASRDLYFLFETRRINRGRLSALVSSEPGYGSRARKNHGVKRAGDIGR